MDNYRRRLGFFGNLSTLSESSNPGRDGRPEIWLGPLAVLAVLLAIFTLSFVLLSYIILAIPMLSVLATLVHEFISCSHTE